MRALFSQAIETLWAKVCLMPISDVFDSDFKIFF